MGLIFQFFLSGLILGFTICGLHSCFFLFPVVVKETQKKIDSIKIGLYFAISKIFVYGIIGGLSSLLGGYIKNTLQTRMLSLLLGIILIIIGFSMLFPIKKHIKIFKTSLPIFLGIVEGITPCAPLFGLIFYLSYLGKNFFFGFISGFLFGFGSVIFPVGIICGLFPYFFYNFFSNIKVKFFFRFLGAGIFFFWAINIFL
ncbi:MAG: hypothetical protein NC816_04765 [Candidatus Omnitrophica bacterium]|nr:hypothetical protein [Candidatus Omnitrophota bacterium]MCM8809764.1 hypothetical protein [Candidatus Omnitrophota bacterium]MCM8811351.1 hypothetical protein [Candidatus Omnitrophota bacterium]MCM8833214.1 hypothetical protein [Candidatus Omnitrophota bacterium]